MRFGSMNARQRLVRHVQELERLDEIKQAAVADLKQAFQDAKAEGYDGSTLKVVLKLRKMTPEQRRERRALEAIYLAALGMLEGDPLPDEARRRLDEPPDAEEKKKKGPPAEEDATTDDDASPEPPAAPQPHQPSLIQKDPAEARQEGEAAAAAGKRVYDNPYRAGDPCRAAWDEGWCAQQQSHGMETPAAYQRRTPKAPEKKDDDKKGDGESGHEGDAGSGRDGGTDADQGAA